MITSLKTYIYWGDKKLKNVDNKLASWI